ncbi:hypothetical protein GCK72_007190 [Caenorhabditis remanei]|uniref:Uncharacterized protein n=1 Tax=Caenorhabditis remanei TaxID=31234 RepID=A0A6A5HJB0_CAERE|nr:hypothetical protein GCK72_007190 [Caenorhabditis remanei]KAF1767231.1 hypothetical protein GCK72_007190 [Caenorhabditis remanei]
MPFTARASEHRQEIHKIIDLVAFLKDVLNENSRQNLKHLNLSPKPSGRSEKYGLYDQFADGWARGIGQLLPSLKSLSIRQRITSETEFRDILKYFPGLTKLDLTHSALDSLAGVSKLKHLETLLIGGISIERSRDFRDIEYLEELKHLSFAANWTCYCCQNGNTVEMYIRHRIYLPKLESLDFSMTKEDDETVQWFVDTHPTLKCLSICETRKIQKIVYPGIAVYHTTTIGGSVKSLQYYLAIGNLNMVDAVLDRMYFQLRDEIGGASDEDLRECLGVINSAAESYSFLDRVYSHSCYSYKNMMQSKDVNIFEASDRKKMIDILLNHLTASLSPLKENISRKISYSWDVLNNRDLLFQAPHLKNTRICYLAMKTVELTDWEYSQPHLLVLDMLKGQADITSNEFNLIDVPQLKAKLRKVRDTKTSDKITKSAAKSVLEYVGIHL